MLLRSTPVWFHTVGDEIADIGIVVTLGRYRRDHKGSLLTVASKTSGNQAAKELTSAGSVCPGRSKQGKQSSFNACQDIERHEKTSRVGFGLR